MRLIKNKQYPCEKLRTLYAVNETVCTQTVSAALAGDTHDDKAAQHQPPISIGCLRGAERNYLFDRSFSTILDQVMLSNFDGLESSPIGNRRPVIKNINNEKKYSLVIISD